MNILEHTIDEFGRHKYMVETSPDNAFIFEFTEEKTNQQLEEEANIRLELELESKRQSEAQFLREEQIRQLLENGTVI